MSSQRSLLVTAIAFSSTLTVTMAAMLPASAQSQMSDVSAGLLTEASATQTVDDMPAEEPVTEETVAEEMTAEETTAEAMSAAEPMAEDALPENADVAASEPLPNLSAEPTTEIVEQPAVVPESLSAVVENAVATDDKAIQQAAAETLIETGEAAVSELTEALAADNAETRAIAAYALSEIGPDAQAATPALLNSLHDDSELVRALATTALTNVGLDRPTLINVLVGAIRNESGLVKDIAMDTLVSIGSDAVPALSNLLANEAVSSIAKQTAASVISNIGLSHNVSETVLQAAVPTLRAALGQDNTLTQLYAADALWTLTGNRDLVMPTLVTAAASGDSTARDLATVGLTYLGRQVLPAVPLLNQVIGNRGGGSRSIAQTALGVVVGSNPAASALGIIARESPRLLRHVPAAVRAVSRLWRW